MNVHHDTRIALGSDCTIYLVHDTRESVVQKLLSELWHTIYDFEKRFSRFIPQSELVQFNLKAGQHVPISPEFHNALQTAIDMSKRTDGLFNPFILPALQRAGYTQSRVPGYETDEQVNFSERSVVSIDKLQLSSETAEIPYGTALDIGGYGKGYLADSLALNHIPTWVQGFWISLGGDIVCGGTDITGKPWEIAIDFNESQPAQNAWYVQASKTVFSVASSSVKRHQGIKNNKKWHHIINPQTLLPADTDCTHATVVAKSAVESDVFASCAIILGSAKAFPWLQARGVASGLIQTQNSILHFGNSIKPRKIKSKGTARG
jgi:thiamine biosynthesis lipoprotein